MLDGARAFFWAQLRAVKPAFVSKTPHFNFISVHCKLLLLLSLGAPLQCITPHHAHVARDSPC